MKQLLHEFFTERPAVSLRGFAHEIGCSEQYLLMLRKGEKPSESMKERIQLAMKKYGFD